MTVAAEQVLAVLDSAAEHFDFPMLDNGYVYLAALRMALFRGAEDWALVIERFGFSPRSGLPSIDVHTFASRLHGLPTDPMHARWQKVRPHNTFACVYPVEDGPWRQPLELVARDATEVVLRGLARPLPSRHEYELHGIVLDDDARRRLDPEDTSIAHVFELCRYLAAIARDDVLATPAERRANVPPELDELMVLEEWHHPDLGNSETPSQSETFQQLALVLATGAPSHYLPSQPPNTHWRHWPLGGTL
jgi:hypothetical protein